MVLADLCKNKNHCIVFNIVAVIFFARVIGLGIVFLYGYKNGATQPIPPAVHWWVPQECKNGYPRSAMLVT